MNIQEIVKQVIHKYSDGYINPFYIAQNMDYIINKEDLGTTNGYYFYYKRHNIIGINYTLSQRAQIRVCAHELGHSILHKDTNYSFLCKKAFFSSSKYEREADIFAIHLLLSQYDKEEIKSFTTQNIADITAYPLKYINYIYYN